MADNGENAVFEKPQNETAKQNQFPYQDSICIKNPLMQKALSIAGRKTSDYLVKWNHGQSPAPNTDYSLTQIQDIFRVEEFNRWGECSSCRVKSRPSQKSSSCVPFLKSAIRDALTPNLVLST